MNVYVLSLVVETCRPALDVVVMAEDEQKARAIAQAEAQWDEDWFSEEVFVEVTLGSDAPTLVAYITHE